jgi:hypothetical protein
MQEVPGSSPGASTIFLSVIHAVLALSVQNGTFFTLRLWGIKGRPRERQTPVSKPEVLKLEGSWKDAIKD